MKGKIFTTMNKAILFLQANTIWTGGIAVVMAAGIALMNIKMFLNQNEAASPNPSREGL